MVKDIYTLEEKQLILKAVKQNNGKEVTMKSLFASVSIDTGVNRYRFVLDWLVENGYVEKKLVKQLSTNYKRYAYTFIKEVQ